MPKYKVRMLYPEGTTEEDDRIFETEEIAREYGLYLCSCCQEGAEILNLSNPGDYPCDSADGVDFEIIEIDE